MNAMCGCGLSLPVPLACASLCGHHVQGLKAFAGRHEGQRSGIKGIKGVKDIKGINGINGKWVSRGYAIVQECFI